MAGISLLHKTPFLLLPHSLHLSFRPNPNPNPNPRLSHFPSISSKKIRKIRLDRSSGGDNQEPGPSFSSFTEEWGESSDPAAAQSPAEPNDDEWGKERPEEVALITDEWGEKTELEAEEAGEADAAADEDEWGNGSPAATAAEEVEEGEEEDRVGDLKRCLVDTFYGTELGFRASAEVRGEIFELVSQLEARNPTPAPNAAPGLLDGNWILVYTAFSELLPLLAVGATPALKVKKITQSIDSKSRTLVNATTLASPFATFSFSASASFEVESPSRIQVQFKEGALQPPEVSSTLNLPDKLEFFGQKIDLQPVQQSLNPIQLAVANLSRGISGQPPLKLPIPGNRAKSWLLTTYLDQDFRISRGDGGLFVLAKEGSPLLDQLSS